MKYSSRLLLWTFIGSVHCAFSLLGGGQRESASDTIVSCAENLQIPRYGPSGRVGERVGPLIIKVIPETTGRPRSIVVEGASGSVMTLVKAWISESTFASRCAGKELVLQFSFVVEGPPQQYPFSWVTFRAPNHFIVHSVARTPRTFDVPEPVDEKKK